MSTAERPKGATDHREGGVHGSARQEILERIRNALGPEHPPVVVGRDYRRADDPGADVVALLADRLVDYRAVVHRCPGPELATRVAAALAGTRTVVVPADVPEDWLSAYRGEIRRDTAAAPLSLTDLDATGVSVLTGCAAAIASTGTLLLDAGAQQGRRVLSLVPDHHVCVVRVDQIAASVPAGLARLSHDSRPVTLVSGPSATSDIELNRVEGVHGPRRLDVIVVDR